ncbi:sigma-54-dependent transcriptional regulator [Nitrosomonas oligotropha]|uniref:Two-component system, response regulator FlrC n=1 Tax=Nitrosomonas oligotropha TaxID=42354 RepID=A0A1H8L160_9PROT|nr:sigma-54 dependent transcriptional regulator [Nitrosomonas oligotropha]SDW17001.1 two-component system, response regulator FlrC [Nitrosomonas oligotropha]SEN98388.1 two-component system, response regulator FlrC [Nitrosomonas oligotropha]
MKALPILVVEDDQDLLEAICTTMKLAGYSALPASNGNTAMATLQESQVGMVVSDVQMKPVDGFALLKKIKAFNPELPVLLMTAYGDVEKAVAAMQTGACDYLLKPFDPDNLLAHIKRHALSEPEQDDNVVAKDPRTRALLSLAKRVAQSPATVMLTGESGCGKEVIARFIHQHSLRAAKPFVAINCAAIPENLLEATLFGYEKGAFTGAAQAQPGKFEQAQGGTLLLDEISEMPLELQAKLLRVLQEREVERVGGHKTIKLDIRVLATSNRDMMAMVKSGRFREDLYYRLNVFPIEIPSLRQRPLDIEPLAQRVLAEAAASSAQPPCTMTQTAINTLTHYTWPGNVRELENVMQRAMILAADNIIDTEHLHLPQANPVQAEESIDQESSSEDMKTLERKHILETLAAVNGSRKLAVKKLGISERTLRYKLQQYRMSS